MDISGSYTLYTPRARVWMAQRDHNLLTHELPEHEPLKHQRDDVHAPRPNTAYNPGILATG